MEKTKWNPVACVNMANFLLTGRQAGRGILMSIHEECDTRLASACRNVSLGFGVYTFIDLGTQSQRTQQVAVLGHEGTTGGLQEVIYMNE